MKGLLDSLTEARVVVEVLVEAIEPDRTLGEGKTIEEADSETEAEEAAAISLGREWLGDTECEGCEGEGAIERGHDEPVDSSRDLKDVALCIDCNGDGGLPGLEEARLLIIKLAKRTANWILADFADDRLDVERLCLLLNGTCHGCGGTCCVSTGCQHGKRSG